MAATEDSIETMIATLYNTRSDAERAVLVIGAYARERKIKQDLEPMVRGFATLGYQEAARILAAYVETLNGRLR